MANSYIEKVLYTGQVPKPLSYEIIREDLIQALSHKIRCRTRGNFLKKKMEFNQFFQEMNTIG